MASTEKDRRLGLAQQAETLMSRGLYDDAIATLDAFIRVGPPTPGAFVMRGHALSLLGRDEESLASMMAVAALEPANPQLRQLVARHVLLLGQFEIGWREFEARLARLPVIRKDLKRWAGEDLGGRRVLVVAEQGHGDTVQFARYVPLARERAASVTAVVQPALRGSLGRWIVMWNGPAT